MMHKASCAPTSNEEGAIHSRPKRPDSKDQKLLKGYGIATPYGRGFKMVIKNFISRPK
jgi:hypothetical protein